jgi:hypothetical protein
VRRTSGGFRWRRDNGRTRVTLRVRRRDLTAAITADDPDFVRAAPTVHLAAHRPRGAICPRQRTQWP